jgi:hypothetical protein
MAKTYRDLSPKQKAARAAYYREYHKRPDRIAKKRQKAVADQRKRRAKIREVLHRALDRPCLDCGIRLPPEVMEFDHIRGEKRINLCQASRAGGYLSWKALREEIEKCDVRCPNCHRLRHYRERCGLK